MQKLLHKRLSFEIPFEDCARGTKKRRFRYFLFRNMFQPLKALKNPLAESQADKELLKRFIAQIIETKSPYKPPKAKEEMENLKWHFHQINFIVNKRMS